MPDTPSRTAAHRHERVRQQHSEELAQDYVEAIHDMLEREGPVRVMDLQEVFGVSHVSVIRALKRFEERGLVTRSRQQGIELTRKGEKMAVEAAARHELITDFLCKLGVSHTQAHADAEGIEHHLSAETLAAIQKFVRKS